MNIADVGLGYAGMSDAVLLAQHDALVAIDNSEARVALVNDRTSPIVDAEPPGRTHDRHDGDDPCGAGTGRGGCKPLPVPERIFASPCPRRRAGAVRGGEAGQRRARAFIASSAIWRPTA